jgi:hypothetical protein
MDIIWHPSSVHVLWFTETAVLSMLAQELRRRTARTTRYFICLNVKLV